MRILVLTKRQYMNKDLLDDRFGRFREIPLALAQKGHRVQGLCLSYRHKTEGIFHDETVKWQSINATRVMVPGLLRFILHASQYARHADVIWAGSDSIYGIIGYLLSKKNHIPLIFDLYDNFESYLMARLPIIKQLYRYVVRNCDKVTCVSKPLEKLVALYGRKKQTVILENAVRKDLFFPLDKEESRKILNLPSKIRIIGTAGALTDIRGIETLFDAFDILQEKYHDLHLAVAGPRNVEIPKGSRIHDLGILPFEKVPVFLNALDIGVVCTKKNEFGNYCFPQKAREMMACDIPIIAANVGSMKELLINKPECLYEPDNASSMIATLDRRLSKQTTDYGELPTWMDLAKLLEKIMLQIGDLRGREMTL